MIPQVNRNMIRLEQTVMVLLGTVDGWDRLEEEVVVVVVDVPLDDDTNIFVSTIVLLVNCSQRERWMRVSESGESGDVTLDKQSSTTALVCTLKLNAIAPLHSEQESIHFNKSQILHSVVHGTMKLSGKVLVQIFGHLVFFLPKFFCKYNNILLKTTQRVFFL